MDVESPLLPLVIEIEAAHGPGVEGVAAPVQLLGAVDMAQAHQIIVGGGQGGGLNDWLILREKLGLPALGVGPDDGEVGGQDAGDARDALGLEADDQLGDLLGEHLGLLLFGEAGVLGPVYPPVEAGDGGHIHIERAVMSVQQEMVHIGLVHDGHIIPAVEVGVEHIELLLTVMVWSAPEDADMAAGAGEVFDVLDGDAGLPEPPVAPDPRLMEHIAGNDGQVRALHAGFPDKSAEAGFNVLEAGVLAAHLWTGETADMPISRMQYAQHHPFPSVLWQSRHRCRP